MTDIENPQPLAGSQKPEPAPVRTNGSAAPMESAEALSLIATTLIEIRDVLAELRDHAQVMSRKNAAEQFRAKGR